MHTVSFSYLMVFAGSINGLIMLVLTLLHRRLSTRSWPLFALLGLLSARLLLFWLGAESLFDPNAWLYIPPVEVSLGYGPLLYLHIVSTARRKLGHIGFHLIPVVLQVLYYLVILLTPLPNKFYWVESIHYPYYLPLEASATVVSLLVYGLLSASCLRQSNVGVKPFRWNAVMVALVLGLAVAWLLNALLVENPIRHFQNQQWLFLYQSLMVAYLSFESWRHWPKLYSTKAGTKRTHTSTLHHSRLDRIREKQWWKEPDIDLNTIARRLGTNRNDLSQSFNSFSNDGFREQLNRWRVEAVCSELQLDPGQPLMALAYKMGFNSKNSFNRHFKRVTGMSPRQYSAQIRGKMSEPDIS